jgi:hypothetical protein
LTAHARNIQDIALHQHFILVAHFTSMAHFVHLDKRWTVGFPVLREKR